MLCLRMSFPSSRQNSSQGVSPALSLFLLPHTQPATKCGWFCPPAALLWALREPHPISFLDSFQEPPKRPPCCQCTHRPAIRGSSRNSNLLPSFPSSNSPPPLPPPPPLTLGESPGWSAWGLHHTVRPTAPIPCPFLPPSLGTSPSCLVMSFQLTPQHPLFHTSSSLSFIQKSPCYAQKLLPSLNFCALDPYTCLVELGTTSWSKE